MCLCVYICFLSFSFDFFPFIGLSVLSYSGLSLFCLIFFYHFFTCLFYLYSTVIKEKKDVDLGRRGSKNDLGGVGGGKSITRI